MYTNFRRLFCLFCVSLWPLTPPPPLLSPFDDVIVCVCHALAGGALYSYNVACPDYIHIGIGHASADLHHFSAYTCVRVSLPDGHTTDTTSSWWTSMVYKGSVTFHHSVWCFGGRITLQAGPFSCYMWHHLQQSFQCKCEQSLILCPEPFSGLFVNFIYFSIL